MLHIEAVFGQNQLLIKGELLLVMQRECGSGVELELGMRIDWCFDLLHSQEQWLRLLLLQGGQAVPEEPNLTLTVRVTGVQVTMLASRGGLEYICSLEEGSLERRDYRNERTYRRKREHIENKFYLSNRVIPMLPHSICK